MKTAVLDCIGGISGDMAVGAFLDAAPAIGKGKRINLAWLSRKLKGLKLKGYSLRARKVMRGGLSGTQFEVVLRSKSGHGVTWSHIRSIIRKSALPLPVRTLSEKILRSIAQVEAKIHGVSVNKVHFHELGAVDSIIDVVAFALCYHACDLNKVYVRNLALGCGSVRSRHGKLPLPAPATLSLLKGFPIKFSQSDMERVTPTGAAFIAAVAETENDIPPLEIERIGYGAGFHNPKKYTNVLRLTIGEAVLKPAQSDRTLLIETNIDDIRPLEFELVYERLFREGALDVFVQPIMMKKMRPAYKLSCIVPHERKEKIEQALFEETPTLGVRAFELDRSLLKRKRKRIRCRYGVLSVVVGSLDGRQVVCSPEYRDCKRIALRKKVPLRRVYNEAKRVARQAFSFQPSAFS